MWVALTQAVAAMLAQVGIKVRTNIVPQGNYFPKIEKHDTSFYVLSWGAGVTADAKVYDGTLTATGWIGAGEAIVIQRCVIAPGP